MCACVSVCFCVTHLRLCVDIGSIVDQLFDHFRLAGQRGYVQSSVSFLDYVEEAQECVLRHAAPVQLHCLCACVSVCVCAHARQCPSEPPSLQSPPLATCHQHFVPLVFQLCPPTHTRRLLCQQCATSGPRDDPLLTP